MPDLIIMDLSMPLLDGWETTKIIKGQPDFYHVPIVVVSAHAMSDEKKKAIECGCDEYISKPYRPQELLSVVRMLLKEEVN